MTLAERLRAALEAPHDQAPILIPSDSRDPNVDPNSAWTEAAVLVAVTDRARPGIILTQRTDQLKRHAGQVAFPGGRIDPGDVSPEAAALREAMEEIALDPAQVDLVGAADRYRTVTGFQVTPVLGVVPPDLPLSPAPGEVSAIFEVPLDFLFDDTNHQEVSVEWQGRMRHYYEFFWEDRRIWGATAAMIVNLSRRLRWLA